MFAKIITAFAFYFFYRLCCSLCTGTDKKNLVGLRSYPDEVQKAVRKHPKEGKIVPQEKTVLSILSGNLLLFTAVFSVLGLALKNVLELKSKFPDLYKDIDRLNDKLNRNDIYIKILCECERRVLLIVYRKNVPEKHIKERNNKAFLSMYGYSENGSMAEYL